MSKSGKITIGGLLVLAVTVFLLKTYVFHIYRIPQNGMYPGIKSGGVVIAKINPYKSAAEVKRGDVIVFKDETQSDQIFEIWRVVGLPGDAIQIMGDKVSINGNDLQRERLRQQDNKIIYRESNGAAKYEVAYEEGAKIDQPPARLKVPPNRVYVLGDNRFDAHDSRYFGPVKFESIIGKKF